MTPTSNPTPSTNVSNSPTLRPGTALAPTTAAYEELTGQRCPTYDDKLPHKTWFATDLGSQPPTALVTYYYLGLDANGNPAVLSVSVTVAIMLSVNIDVFGQYQSWTDYVASLTPSPSTASFAAPFNSFPASPINPAWLSTPSEAAQLIAEMNSDFTAAGINVTATAQEVASESGSIYTYATSDARRVYNVVLSNGQIYAMRLLKQQRFASGVWCAGAWTLLSSGPSFVPEVFPGVERNTSSIPQPIDPKYADTTQWEAFTVFPGVIGVRAKGSGPVDVTAVTTKMADQINQIYNKLFPSGS